LQTFEKCTKLIKGLGVPVLFLGGGGYAPANAARCYALITNVLTKESNQLPLDIPTHKYLENYLPDTRFRITADTAKKNCNDAEDIEILINYIKNNVALMSSTTKLSKNEEESTESE